MALPDTMSSALTKNELQLLRSLVPLYTLSDERFGELIADLRVEDGPRGTTLFECGDTDQANVYLLKGILELFDGEKLVEQIDTGSSTARFPIAHIFPRQYTARVKAPARIVRLDSRKLSDALASEHTQDYQVSDLDNAVDGDWMTQLLQSRVLQQVPASNIQRVMMCVEQVEAQPGECIIRQGDAGDFYYMLSSGQAVVSRDMGDGRPPVELARLSPGSAFGEEALLSDAPRNSTITMLTPGQLLRLSKADFVELIHNPLTSSHDYDTARALVERGAVWLDVRRSDSFESDHLPDSLNLPFESLRYQTGSLAQDRHYIVIADSETTMAAAAFLLTEQGYDVSVLEGGYDTVRPQLKLVTPYDSEVFGAPPKVFEPRSNDADNETFVSAASVQVPELEAQVVKLKNELDAAVSERQHANELQSAAVDEARENLRSLEEERALMLQERDLLAKAADEARARLQESELEREGMRQQLTDLQQRDEVWQTRLRKAEGQGIAERDRAESVSQRYDNQVRQIERLREEREVEREAYAKSQGQLKEQITELQLNLDLAQGDLDTANNEVQGMQNARVSDAARIQDLLSAKSGLEQQLESARARIQELDGELDQLRCNTGDKDATRQQLLDQLESAEAKIASVEQQLAERNAAMVALQDEDAKAGQLSEAANSRLQALTCERDRLVVELAQVSATERGESEYVRVNEQLRSQLECTAAQLASLQIEYDQLSTDSEDLRAEQSRELKKVREQTDELRDELVLVGAERDNLREKLAATAQQDEIGAESEHGLFALKEDIRSVQRDRDAARDEANELRNEVESLREVMEKYVDQIRAAQSSTDDVEALNAELRTVRDQAARDVASLRKELAFAQAKFQEQQDNAANAPLAEEAMRQELSALRDSLAERQRELATADLARRRIEDQLEDAAREIERLRRQGDAVKRQSTQTLHTTARPPSEALASDPADDIDDILDRGLRDRRVKPLGRALDMGQVTGRSRTRSVTIGLIIGLLLVVVGFEAATLLTGRGELFAFLFAG